jgi:hypothetical protein
MMEQVEKTGQHRGHGLRGGPVDEVHGRPVETRGVAGQGPVAAGREDAVEIHRAVDELVVEGLRQLFGFQLEIAGKVFENRRDLRI